MTKKTKVWLGVVALLGAGLFGRFVYFNLVVPWPYREELQACLATADGQPDEAATTAARDSCFRTYPHFN